MDAFLEVLEKESAETAKALVLGNMSKFVDQQPAVTPMVRLNEDTVAQRHPDRLGRNKPKLCSNCPKEVICRRDHVDGE